MHVATLAPSESRGCHVSDLYVSDLHLLKLYPLKLCPLKRGRLIGWFTGKAKRGEDIGLSRVRIQQQGRRCRLRVLWKPAEFIRAISDFFEASAS